MRLTAPATILPALLVAAGNAPAQTSTSPSPADDATLVIGEPVVVRGRAVGPFQTRDVMSSVDVLPGTRIRSENVANAWELLGKVPGVMITEFRQGTTSGKFSFRGFNGEGEINAVKLLIDGIPSNSNDGNMPYLDMIFPLDIASVEVVRGTNDPRYGLHNIAGNTNITTRSGGNYVDGRLAYGSFATRDAQFAAGIERGAWSSNYAVAYRKSQGYRDHAEAEKISLSAKAFYGEEDGPFRAGIIARHYYGEAEEPGYLTFADSRAVPKMSYPFSSTDGGEREMNHLSGHLDAELDHDLSLSTKLYLNRFDDQRWIKFSAGVSQQERDTNESHQGLLSTLTWRPGATPVGDVAVEGGFNFEKQQNTSLRFLTVDRVRQSQTRAQNFDFDNVGAYVQTVIKPVPRLSVIPAYRVDRLDGSFTNALTGGVFAVNDYGLIQQPKLSVIYTPVDGYSVYGNWGRTFQVGVGAAAYKITRTNDLAPSINTGWELGVKFAPAPWLDGRVALWQQVASDEARRKLNDPANDSENIGRTRRRGVDLQVNMRPAEPLTVWVGSSFQGTKILQADAATPASQGREIDHVPHYLVTGGVEYRASEKLRLLAWLNAQGDYYLERTNTTGRFGRRLLIDIGGYYEVSRHVRVELQLKNLTDQYYEYVWYDGTQTLHSPGDRRALYGAVTLAY